MPMALQQRADYETLLLTFYRTLRELNLKTRHAPSGKQFLYWIETYGFDVTEQGIQRGLGGFSKKITDGVIRSDKDAMYMVNYLNATIKGIRTDFEPARTQTAEDTRTQTGMRRVHREWLASLP
jgi:hypothetical protein